MPCYHCLQNNNKNVIQLTNLFFTTMVTAACSDNGRNLFTCIEKGKPKNNNKIKQHEKNKPIFQFPLFFFLVQPLFCSNNHHCNCHCRPSRQLPATHVASPLLPLFPPPLQRRNNQQSIIIIILSIKIIISIRHSAAANAPLLLLPPPRYCCISKHAVATAKITLLPSCRLRRQAGCRHRAAAATTSTAAQPPPRYHCLQIKKM
jgi:hypothetical protein